MCLGSLSCWKVNLCPSLRSSGAGFHQGFLFFAPLIFSSILTSLPVPAAEKDPHSMMLPPPSFTVGMVPGFLQTWLLAFRPRVQSWFHQTRESCFSWSESPLGVFWQTPSGLSCAFYWGVASIWPLCQSAIWFLVTSLTKAPLPWLLSLAGRPGLGWVFVVPNFFHLGMMEVNVFLCSLFNPF